MGGREGVNWAYIGTGNSVPCALYAQEFGPFKCCHTPFSKMASNDFKKLRGVKFLPQNKLKCRVVHSVSETMTSCMEKVFALQCHGIPLLDHFHRLFIHVAALGFRDTMQFFYLFFTVIIFALIMKCKLYYCIQATTTIPTLIELIYHPVWLLWNSHAWDTA